MTARMGQSGFVLVNALVLVAAMAAAAVFLLARAEDGRARLAAVQTGEALRGNLDAMEAMGKAVLARDGRQGDVDSLTDAWARPIPSLDLERGRVSGRITDEQGLFNLNWLANPENDRAAEAFEELLARLGLAPQIGDAIVAFVSNTGPRNRGAYAQLDPGLVPLGGPVLLLDQIAAMPEMSAGDFERLRPFITALPVATRLNVNTAPEVILRAMLPELSSAQITSVLRKREDEPFIQIELFFEELSQPTDIEENPEAIEIGQFSVQSNWFLGRFSAELETYQAQRDVLYLRGGGAQIDTEWRVTRFGED
ncbi:MAG: type II secretion system minor pseudopilin GspK [Pseudomonadota bacterium]